VPSTMPIETPSTETPSTETPPRQIESPPAEAGLPETVSAESGPRFSRAMLALTAAATLAVVPVSTAAVGPAGSGASAHSSPVYVLAQAAHDIGHNDWAFQGGVAGRVAWVVSYVALGLFWLVIALWIRRRVKRAGLDRADSRRRLWIKTLIAAWATEGIAGSLTLGAGLYADWNSSTLGPAILRASDLCSPWLSFAAVLLVVGLAEHRSLAIRAALLYAALLAVILLVPLPGPDAVKVLILAAAAAVPALLDSGAPAEPGREGHPGSEPGPLRPPAAAAG
jgi:hypothetical protein